MYDPSQQTPDMDLVVSLGVFHDTHSAAHQVKDALKNGVEKLSSDELRTALAKLQAGQRLSDAETGPDFMFAANYIDAIITVQSELASR